METYGDYAGQKGATRTFGNVKGPVGTCGDLLGLW